MLFCRSQYGKYTILCLRKTRTFTLFFCFYQIVNRFYKRRYVISQYTQTTITRITKPAAKHLSLVTVVKADRISSASYIMTQLTSGLGRSFGRHPHSLRNFNRISFSIGGFLRAIATFWSTQAVSCLVKRITSTCISLKTSQTFHLVTLGTLLRLSTCPLPFIFGSFELQFLASVTTMCVMITLSFAECRTLYFNCCSCCHSIIPCMLVDT